MALSKSLDKASLPSTPAPPCCLLHSSRVEVVGDCAVEAEDGHTDTWTHRGKGGILCLSSDSWVVTVAGLGPYKQLLKASSKPYL